MFVKLNATYDKKTKKVILMRDGIYDYMGFQLNDFENPYKVYKVNRPKDEVIKAYTLLKDHELVVTDDHPDEMVTEENISKYRIGVVKDFDFEDGDLANLKEPSRLVGTIHLDRDHKYKEVSVGWRSKNEISKSENYDIIQRVADINHLAIVRKGRCGSFCSIQDKLGDDSMITFSKLLIDAGINPDTIDSDKMKKVEDKLSKSYSTTNNDSGETVKNLNSKISDLTSEVQMLKDSSKGLLDTEKVTELTDSAMLQGYKDGQEIGAMAEGLNLNLDGKTPCEAKKEISMKVLGVDKIEDGDVSAYFKLARSDKYKGVWGVKDSKTTDNKNSEPSDTYDKKMDEALGE